MKKILPFILICFGLAAAGNLAGQLWMGELARMTKPALLPLLARATISVLPVEDKERNWLIAAQLFGWLGDVLLMQDALPWFGSGMAAFLTGHIFYMRFFGGRSWKGLSLKTWILSGIAMAALVALLLIGIGVKGVLLPAMAIYGSALMLLCFSALCGVIRFGGKAWWLLLCGAVLFTISDSFIAMKTFGVEDWSIHGFIVMSTYITAQALLAAGAVKLKK